MNLLSNALKFTIKGGIFIKIDVQDLAYKEGDESMSPDKTYRDVIKDQNKEMIKKKLMIEIEDTGIGIKQKDLCKLFKYFGRLDDKQQINRKGTGLGLNITKRIVQSMSGEIQIESEFRKGTKFSLYVIIEVKNPNYKPQL